MNKSDLKYPKQTATCMAILLALSLAASTPAQTLARPGWAGSGMAAQSWFKHAVLYRIDTRGFSHGVGDAETGPGTLKGITGRLDYIRDLGIDAILLEDLAPAKGTDPVDPTVGAIEDFDELSLQASKRSLRILLTLQHPNPSLARFWLTRGVAGFYIPGSTSSADVAAIRKLLPGSVSQRILITDADLIGTPAKSPGNEIQLDTAFLKLPSQPTVNSAAEIRNALEQSQALLHNGTPAITTDAQGTPRSSNRFAPAGSEREAARLAAAVLLLNRTVPVIYAGQELGLTPTNGESTIAWGKPPAIETEPAADPTAPAPPPPPPPPDPSAAASERYVPYVPPTRPVKPSMPPPPDPATAAGEAVDENSLLSFYRQLIQLHHGKTSVRDGDEILLNYDSESALVLVRRPANASLANPALIVVCNLSAKPLILPLKASLTKLHLRGSFLRSALNPGSQPVSMNLEPVTLPSFGVYIGELRY